MEGGCGFENFCFPCSTRLSGTFDIEQKPLMLCTAAGESEIVWYFIFLSDACIPMAVSEQMHFNLKHYEFIKECRTDIDAFIVKSAQHITSLLQEKSWANRLCNTMWRLRSVVLVWLKLAEKSYNGCFFFWDPQGGNCSSLHCLWPKLLWTTSSLSHYSYVGSWLCCTVWLHIF